MKPHGMGDLYAAQIVGVGFHSFPGEGAASCGTAVKLNHRLHRFTQIIKKNKKNQCNQCNLWFLLYFMIYVFL
jgi:hypothetical protein